MWGLYLDSVPAVVEKELRAGRFYSELLNSDIKSHPLARKLGVPTQYKENPDEDSNHILFFFVFGSCQRSTIISRGPK
jgi:hypothetical protein